MQLSFRTILLLIQVGILLLLVVVNRSEGYFEQKIFYFQELERELKNDNTFFKLAQPPLLHDSIIYDTAQDLLIILTKDFVYNFKNGNFSMENKMRIFDGNDRIRCKNYKYLPPYPCHSMGYWASSLTSSSLETSSKQNNLLFMCFNNGTAVFINMLTLTHVSGVESGCYRESILNLVSSNNVMYGLTLEIGPVLLRFSPKYPITFKRSSLKNLVTRLDSNWLQQNDYLEFVHIFESDSHVYFVLKEVAEEDKIYCDKKVVKSRIARISKSDEGGSKYRLTDNWVTFVKTTISCPIKSSDANSTSQLNHVESAYFDKSLKLLFATFSAGRFGASQSSICTYPLVNINLALDGPYYNMKEPTVPVPRSETTCITNLENCIPNKASQYQLKYQPIQPKSNSMESNHEIWYKISSMSFERSSFQYVVVFVATDTFKVHKFYRKITQDQLCYSETIDVSTNSLTKFDRIVDLQIINSKMSMKPFLIVSTSVGVYHLGIENCHMYKSQDTCRDIFCFWSTTNSKCSTIYTIPVYKLKSLPELTYCTKANQNRGNKLLKSDWSVWSPCGSNENRCMCRKRVCKSGLCVNNIPNNRNEDIQISNCTKLHEWSDWLSWSPCSSTCGLGNQQRRRYCYSTPGLCGNGPDLETRSCQAHLACDDAQNQQPGPWSPCSVPCGSGLTYRRKCMDNSREDCKLLDTKNCQGTLCGNTEKLSSPIIIKDKSGKSVYYTAICSSKSKDDTEMNVKVEYEVENYSTMDNKITSCWSVWSNCTNCNSEDNPVSLETQVTRSRTRVCLLQNNKDAHSLCYGQYEQKEDCGEICDKFLSMASIGSLSGTLEFELVYILVVGLASFLVTFIITVVAFCCICKNKMGMMRTESGTNSIPPGISRSPPIFLHSSYSPTHSPGIYPQTGYFAEPTMGTFQRNRHSPQQPQPAPQPIHNSYIPMRPNDQMESENGFTLPQPPR